MGRNCNLDLHLRPPVSDTDHHQNNNHCREPMTQEENESQQHTQHHQQKLTIVYNGNVSVCDVTEQQARAIFSLASREMSERVQRSTPSPTSLASSPAVRPRPDQLYNNPSTGLSMKRSLQRFLLKRKTRIQDTCPYNVVR